MEIVYLLTPEYYRILQRSQLCRRLQSFNTKSIFGNYVHVGLLSLKVVLKCFLDSSAILLLSRQSVVGTGINRTHNHPIFEQNEIENVLPINTFSIKFNVSGSIAKYTVSWAKHQHLFTHRIDGCHVLRGRIGFG